MSRPDASIRNEAHQWRARIDDSLNEAEQAEFQRWVQSSPAHGEAYAEAELVWHALGTAPVADAVTRHRKAEAVSHLAASRTHSLSRTFQGAGMAIAAMVVLFVAAAFFYDSTPETESLPQMQTVLHQTELGEIKELRLDDGSQVVLGPRSTIEVALGAHARQVELLAGSAFFDVSSDPGRPFKVRAGAAEVLVTGTAFDLQRKNSGLHVAVREGLVELSHPLVLRSGINANKGQSWERNPGDVIQTVGLAAGEAVSASNSEGIGQTRSVNRDQVGAWRQGQLIYFRASLAEIAADLNRYRNRPLVLDTEVESLRLSGTFKVNDMDQLLDMIELALPIQIIADDEKDLVVPDR